MDLLTRQVSSRGKHVLIQMRVGRAGEGEQSPAWRRGSTGRGTPYNHTGHIFLGGRNPNAGGHIVESKGSEPATLSARLFSAAT